MVVKYGVAVLLVVALCSVPAVLSAEVYLSAAGGVFVPYDGNAGGNGVIQILSGVSAQFRVGGEVEYRSYSSKIFDVDDVGIDTGSIRAVVHYYFVPEGVRPYVGAGLGLNINVIDSNKVEHQSPTIISVNQIGVGIGMLGLAGVEVPLGEAVALFAEGRAGVDFQLTDQSDGSGDDIGVENLGGFSGIGGVRLRF